MNQFWYLEFTWDFGLTEPASRDLDTILVLLSLADDGIAVLKTFIFVMTLFRDRSGRTTGCASLASIIEVVKAVGLIMWINFLRRFEGQINDHAPYAHGLAFYCNQSVAQPESSEAAGISDVTLGQLEAIPTSGDRSLFQKGEFMGATALYPFFFNTETM